MIFSPIELVKYVSTIMTLNKGDIIATGTPPGVGQLQKNDTVSITIENIGTLENIIK
jgi:2-keto-4-pentenoate hydratase/2-oxohepta-3-ene-1,7-dioic acid hydratase in catechol pathway